MQRGQSVSYTALLPYTVKITHNVHWFLVRDYMVMCWWVKYQWPTGITCSCHSKVSLLRKLKKLPTPCTGTFASTCLLFCVSVSLEHWYFDFASLPLESHESMCLVQSLTSSFPFFHKVHLSSHSMSGCLWSLGRATCQKEQIEGTRGMGICESRLKAVKTCPPCTWKVTEMDSTIVFTYVCTTYPHAVSYGPPGVSRGWNPGLPRCRQTAHGSEQIPFGNSTS